MQFIKSTWENQSLTSTHEKYSKITENRQTQIEHIRLNTCGDISILEGG